MKTVVLALFSLLLRLPSIAQQDSLMALLRQGVALNDQGDFDGALRHYDDLISRHPDYYNAYNEKTLTLFEAGRYQESVDLCKLVLKKFEGNEDNGKIYVNYGSSLDALGQPDEALKIYSEGKKNTLICSCFPSTGASRNSNRKTILTP